MADYCDDNRFELINKYKQELIDGTNIETAQDEMAVINDILFRFWQMGWLDKLEQPEQRWIPCERELPEVGRSILVSVGGIYTAEGCLRDDGDWTQFRWDAIQRKDMVGAWMPLPSPYKGDEHENN